MAYANFTAPDAEDSATSCVPRVRVVVPFPTAPQVCRETIALLEDLLEDARCGEVTGLAFVAMRKSNAYVADATGAAFINPTFARGMVASLDDYLRDLVHRKR
ncbi:MAG: hypothetical protein ROZ37_04175 [Aromatoleum sp.]|jgi:hypothetical protein|uniref:hypothetical protein n=1 Tax=Aromatoleum sp. TaxID=2307007 RepID=UPI002894B1F9|nr:hypothetical protein [Aromatoleum sp.]MDT3669516.1 hypothetical protein [Aromatoleum sp.]